MISRQTSSIYWAKLALVLSLLFSTTHAYTAAQGRYDPAEGKYLDPRVKTNVNKVDPLFDENINDYRSFERDMLEHKKGIAAGVGRGLGAKDVVGANEAGRAANELSQISANDLESRGRAKGAEDPMFNEIFVDYSKPGNMQIKKDMEKIAESSGKMMKVILGMLKDLGVDCKSVKGNTTIEPQYHIDLKNRTDRDKGETVYDPHFCEQPRREYNCTDTLTLKCLHFSDTPVRFEITGSNIMYRARAGSNYTSYEFTNKGGFEDACSSGGGTAKGGFGNNVLGAVGLGIQKGSSNTFNASETGVTVNFRISADTPQDAISKIELTNMQFTTLMQLKVNGNSILVAPTAGDKLEVIGQHEEVTKGKKKFGGKFGARVTNRTYYPIVSTGSSQVILGQVQENNSLETKDLKHYLKEGDNTIEIKVLGINQALVSFSLNAYQKVCLNWHEDWSEKCTLQ